MNLKCPPSPPPTSVLLPPSPETNSPRIEPWVKAVPKFDVFAFFFSGMARGRGLMFCGSKGGGGLPPSGSLMGHLFFAWCAGIPHMYAVMHDHKECTVYLFILGKPRHLSERDEDSASVVKPPGPAGTAGGGGPQPPEHCQHPHPPGGVHHPGGTYARADRQTGEHRHLYSGTPMHFGRSQW